jgi:hypothetical protein
MDPKDKDYDEKQGAYPARWLPSDQFQTLFNEHRPRLVFLHACKGAYSDSQRAFQSVARQLVSAEIPAVVAMQYDISVQAASIFAQKFYEQLAQGSDIDEAVRAGRIELGNQIPPYWGHPCFGTPVVYLQTDGAIVLPIVEVKANGKEMTVESTPLTVRTTGVSKGMSSGAADAEAGSIAPDTDRSQSPSGFDR